MNNAVNTLRNRAVQATVLAALLWLGRLGFGWWWLLFPMIGALLYAVICLTYAGYLWWLAHH